MDTATGTVECVRTCQYAVGGGDASGITVPGLASSLSRPIDMCKVLLFGAHTTR
jgi:hypothetical protein